MDAISRVAMATWRVFNICNIIIFAVNEPLLLLPSPHTSHIVIPNIFLLVPDDVSQQHNILQKSGGWKVVNPEPTLKGPLSFEEVRKENLYNDGYGQNGLIVMK